MLPYKLIAAVYFEGSSLHAAAAGIILIVGQWKLFQKSGIRGWWAAVPCARNYMLARCAGREEEGRVVAAAALIEIVTEVLLLLFPHSDDSPLLVLAAVIVVPVAIIQLIYEIRVYLGLIEVYGEKRRWLLLWILVPWITALLWGSREKYQPGWKAGEFRSRAKSYITGSDVSGMDEGLTVNLKERSVWSFFQKKTLLRDIHMYIKPGRMVLLLGGSGAGKTTFLNAVNGYEKADAKIRLNGSDVYAEYKKMQFEVGFVPQQELMRGKDTVYRTLYDAALLRLPAELTAKDRKERVNQVLEIFGLTPVKNSLVEKLSGGQKKRLSIAMELISSPALFILDEPDSGLDGVMARELAQQLRRIADMGRVVIVITHTPDRVIDLFDDVIVLAKDTERTGRLAFFGTIEEARAFFGKESMEEIVKSVNRKEEGGDGRADEFIEKFAEVQNA
ncbi:MAG: ABC transporter ATP-binding protein [Stomatobaculum sp.]|nr:ABC transporter ATP-binding protein [Stomatobaculum sp.]